MPSIDIVCRSLFSRCMILALLAPMAALAGAEPTVEFPVWSRSWTGTLGSKTVEVTLRREADQISGRYCYQPCREQTRYQLELKGQVQGQGAELTERDNGHAQKVTGQWQIETLGDAVTGVWLSPDGKRKLPLRLHPAQSQDDLEARFPYEIRLVANALPEEGDTCSDPPLVSAIRLYRDGELFQSLDTESQGTCNLFMPELIDANFDGWPDLTIAQFLPAGPNVPYQTWLYDPSTQRFVDAPAMLQAISSPDFDPVHKIIASFWRASCCEHGVSIYRWEGGDVVEVDTQSSYLLPVLDGETQRLCYVVPGYGDGFIEYPSRIEQGEDGRLRLLQIDPKTCDTFGSTFLERTYIDIWKPALPGQKPVLLRREGVESKSTSTSAGQRYCPEVPFFDNGRIRRVVLSDNTDMCSERSPHSDPES